MTDRNTKGTRPPGNGPDEVAELVRRAGKRPPVPAEELARIKAATHAGWKEQVGRRPTRRGGGLFAGLAAAAIIIMAVSGWYWIRESQERGTGLLVARVQSIVGTASIHGDDAASHSIAVGQEIPVGAWLTTTGSGRLALIMPTGHSVRIDRASRIRMLAASRIGLDSGGIYVDSGLTTPAKPLAILTPAGEVRDVGTQFETRLLESSLRVRVREGSVNIAGAAGLHEVSAGVVLELAEDGSVTRTDSPPYGPEWEWIAEVTPMMDVEGRPLLEFLEWIARERGWALAFADAGTEERAATIIIDGSIDGLTLDQAVETVFATCRLTYRVEQGVLHVQPDEVEARR